MSPFLSGALGALAVLLTVGFLKRIVWMRRLHRFHGRPHALRFLFRRLRTRPEQEQVISGEAEALFSEVRALRTDVHGVRDEVADLLSAPATDVAAVQAAIDARIARLAALRARLAEAVARIHATLDPQQRTALAALVREGGHHRHHHRCAHGHC
ncbi:MAG TPA: periplasmic heavy metal sensor [Anaeromyxobacteraceae bacterium]|nr:periplasmic heavy metal sensor [Anaeromyxobacteraceae bacterium]